MIKFQTVCKDNDFLCNDKQKREYFYKNIIFYQNYLQKAAISNAFLVFPTQVAYVSRLAYGVNAAIALM